MASDDPTIEDSYGSALSTTPKSTTGSGDDQGFLGELRHDAGAVTDAVDSNLTTLGDTTRHNFAHVADSIGDVASGPASSTPAKKKADDGKNKTNTSQNKSEQNTLEGNVQKVLAPQQAELDTLPGDYSQVMAQIDALPAGDSGMNSMINQSVANTTSALEAGQSNLESALGAEAKAGRTYEENIPYQDVLATTLAEKKGELQYGTIPTEVVNTSDWSQNLKGIYDYIQGTSVSTSTQSQNPDNLPAILGSGDSVGGTGNGSTPAASGVISGGGTPDSPAG